MSASVLEQLLEALDTETARNMLKDLKNPELRSPQLYNAVGKYLERHKFTLAKLRPDESLLGDLASALADVPELTDEELYGSTQH
ncbi:MULTISPECIES: DNA packaging protein [unclassified Pseudomonas]|uniref:DNA packaging protein n=1 Tax=unclassified Pseudomonas TaxID=196821 RepID=UPI000C885E38|nr:MULTISPECIES: DNA packaging protein [unclassified Pseudomonas]PMX14124.1 DNA packaging protein [Pseudomonas sp. MPBC4-3]PMX46260.1 DNA packaging protein [Pseudomonas sp. FW301-21B01]PMY07065.1 DNA packaging protein [Pseudomonas sp. MPR-R5A]PNA67883.1 DNA packaging protein [Pseudomonas sp. MPR-R5B]